jgi:hypothetical protein
VFVVVSFVVVAVLVVVAVAVEQHAKKEDPFGEPVD